MIRIYLCPLLLAGLSWSGMAAAAASATAPALTPAFHTGASFGNVFSRTVAVQAPGFDEAVHRISGTAIYRVTDAALPARLHIDYRYDGRTSGSGAVELSDGGATNCYEGKCTPNTDASGLAYNPRLWGTPPTTLKLGQHWTVDIAEPWELGPAGKQTVTVVALDTGSHTVTLEREGSGDGAWLGEKSQLTMTRDGKPCDMTRQAGHAHWHGYTTFRDGIVLSDELVSTRQMSLSSARYGRIEANERQYILLNAMPVEAAR
ncbi:hypothetical protein [Rhodanobacter sp. DHG33]|uniref:hypothetical protein n=1 Tax=Rhodanobacter sp. DHG33 TaxID=2775921 RepID=UPI00177DC885|nr:hypothetical protein [Rhodanobacter sp. DHG33]MBD8898797.1 hypothetical protein [Rhodanobacter sp. DHG33]